MYILLDVWLLAIQATIQTLKQLQLGYVYHVWLIVFNAGMQAHAKNVTSRLINGIVRIINVKAFAKKGIIMIQINNLVLIVK